LPGWVPPFTGLVPRSGGGVNWSEELASPLSCRCPSWRTGTPAFAGLGAHCRRALCSKSVEPEAAVGLALPFPSCPDLVCRDRPVVFGWASHEWALCSQSAEPGAWPDSLLPGCASVPAFRPNACVLQAGICACRPRVDLLQSRRVVVRFALQLPFGAQPVRRSARAEGRVLQLGSLVLKSGGAGASDGGLLPDLASVPGLDRCLCRAWSCSLAGLVLVWLRRLKSRFEGLALRRGSKDGFSRGAWRSLLLLVSQKIGSCPGRQVCSAPVRRSVLSEASSLAWRARVEQGRIEACLEPERFVSVAVRTVVVVLFGHGPSVRTRALRLGPSLRPALPAVSFGLQQAESGASACRSSGESGSPEVRPVDGRRPEWRV